MSVANASAAASRRFDIDWLRLVALGLLIIYHTLCVFDASPWVTKSDHAGPWAQGAVFLLTPWRMSLVFVIGGVAARFLFEKLGAAEFLRDRAQRLLVPYVLAVLVLAPPQTYVNAVETAHERGPFLDYWIHRAWSGVEYHGLRLPQAEHAWFLPYLFAYAAAAALVWSVRRRCFDLAQNLIGRLPAWALPVVVMAWFAFMDAVITPLHQRSLFIFTDVTGHLRWAPIFFLGIVVGRGDLFWEKLIGARTWLLALSLVLTALCLAAWGLFGVSPSPGETTLLTVLRACFGGAMLFTVLSWGARLLNRPSAALRYGGDAILPVYLLHQTVLVLAAHYSGANHWPVALEFVFLAAASVGGSLALYQFVIRDNGLLRFLFGLRPRRRGKERLAVEAPAAAA